MSIGLFSLKGNTSVNPLYEITSPVFDRVVIHLDDKYYDGKQFEIVALNNSDRNMYIQSASINDLKLSGPWFLHEQMKDGGKMVIEMGSEPNKTWGTDLTDIPK